MTAPHDAGAPRAGGAGAASGAAALEAWLPGMGVSLSPGQFDALLGYLRSVAEAGTSVNLTADLDVDLMLRRHAADALAALPFLRRRLAGRASPSILDLGAGAGFIGATLKIAWPQAEVTLMESSYRKFLFLNEAALRLGLKGLRVAWQRAGSPAAGAARGYDAVLARAVAKLPRAVGLGLGLAGPGGCLVCWQTAEPDQGEPALAGALASAGARIAETLAYRLPGEAAQRRLVVITRTEGT